MCNNIMAAQTVLSITEGGTAMKKVNKFIDEVHPFYVGLGLLLTLMVVGVSIIAFT